VNDKIYLCLQGDNLDLQNWYYWYTLF